MELRDYYRQKKRKALFNKFILIFVTVIALGVLIWGFFWLPYFRVLNIKVSGYLDDNAIIKAISPFLASVNLFFLPKNNYWLLNTGDIGQMLKNNGLGYPEINKQFPNNLLINYKEAKPWLMYCQDQNNCFYVDQTGILGDSAPHFSANPLPEIAFWQNKEIKTGEQLISKSEAAFFSDLFNNLNKINIIASKIEILPGSDLKIITSENWYLLISNNAALDILFQDLKLLLEQKINGNHSKLEYIDMRFPNKAFYKLKLTH